MVVIELQILSEAFWKEVAARRNKFLQKMKPLLFIVAIAFSLILIGCANTEGTFDIEGKVLDEYTKKAIPNRNIIIQGLLMSDSKLIPTGDISRFQTDNSGHFTYTLRKTKNAYWYSLIFVGDSTYSYSTQKISLEELTRNSKFLSFGLDKFADLTIQIERINKSAPFDTLFFSWKTNDSDGRIYPHKVINFGIAPDFEFRWIGGNVKSRIETKTFSNKNTIVHMVLYRKGRIKEMKDTIYCYRDVKNYFTFKY